MHNNWLYVPLGWKLMGFQLPFVSLLICVFHILFLKKGSKAYLLIISLTECLVFKAGFWQLKV